MSNNTELIWQDVSRRLISIFKKHEDQFMITIVDNKRMVIQAKVIGMSKISADTDKDYETSIEPYTLLVNIDKERTKGNSKYIFFHLPIPAHIDALCAFFIYIAPISTYMEHGLTMHNIDSCLLTYSAKKDSHLCKKYSNLYPSIMMFILIEYDVLDQFFDILSDYYKYIDHLKLKIEDDYVNMLESL